MSIAIHSIQALTQQLLVQFPVAWNPAVMNNQYCAATRDWVAGPFSKYLFHYFAARGDLKWRFRGNQCEHFALRAALEAVKLFSDTRNLEIPAEAESLAVAACKYKSDTLGWHEVNLWLIDGAWHAWEPQAFEFFQFTEAERLTVQQVIIP